jgi:UDP-3-O-[3-hydroxymyristoyl] glucosamine N-acyltransferase
MEVTAKAISQILNGTIEGDPNVRITHPAKIEAASSGAICFLSNPKYEAFAYDTKASAILVSEDFAPQRPIPATLIRVKDVRMAITMLLQQFGQQPEVVAPTSEVMTFVSPDAKVGSSTTIGAFTVIRAGAVVGEGCQLHEQVFIGDKVRVGNNCTIYPGVKIMFDCVIGDNCVLHANVVIGSDGFGFLPQADGSYKKVPQIGNVVIGNDVEIGANTVIDRATMGSTVIKDGVKLDNLIQIAHNVEIDENTAIAAQTGIAGSAKIGKSCMIGGQVGIAGHIKIADGTRIQAQSGVGTNITTPNTALYGSPAFGYHNFLRSQVLFKKLPLMEKRLQALEKMLEKE